MSSPRLSISTPDRGAGPPLLRSATGAAAVSGVARAWWRRRRVNSGGPDPECGAAFRRGGLRTAIAPTLREIAELAAVAAIRTALNFFLGRESKEERAELALRTGDTPESPA